MISGVKDIYYNVCDMNRAVKFYCDVLGMKVIHQDEYWTSLDCSGVEIGLHWTEGGNVPPLPRDAHRAHCGATLTLKIANATIGKEKLEQAGAKILGTANEPWGNMVVFEDPDGNVLKLMESK